MKLGVNIDHVATIRQARGTVEPDPVEAAALAVKGGADSIVCHLREDRRHIQDRDLARLKETLERPLNLEMAMWEEIIEIAIEVKPDRVTFVPERREERTTEGGLEVLSDLVRVREVVGRFRKAGVKVSLFVEPDARQIESSREAGADAIELHTGRYATMTAVDELQNEIKRISEAAQVGARAGLFVAAGHGLDLGNVSAIAAIPMIEELNIGHSIVGRSMFVGFEQAVREMREAMSAAKGG